MQQFTFEFTAKDYVGQFPLWAGDEEQGRKEAKLLILAANPQWQDCLKIGKLVAVI